MHGIQDHIGRLNEKIKVLEEKIDIFVWLVDDTKDHNEDDEQNVVVSTTGNGALKSKSFKERALEKAKEKQRVNTGGDLD